MASASNFTMTINGRKVTAWQGESVLDAAKRAGIHIPTLCHHPAVEPFGSCRLCMVEVTKQSWKGWKGLMTACLYPAAPDLMIETNSERVRHVRKNVLDLLLARCPDSTLIQDLAQEYGISQTTFVPRENPDLCILCGLCVRVCEQSVTSAITTAFRGHNRKIASPWEGPPEDCIGCGACASVCPTGHIVMEEMDGIRSIWKRKFPMVLCKTCGKPLMTEAEQKHLVEKTNLDISYFEECSACKRSRTAKSFAQVVWKTHPGFVPKEQSMGGHKSPVLWQDTKRRAAP